MLTLLLASTAILVYGVVLAQYVPERWHLIANLLASAVAVLSAIWSGLSAAELGLDPAFVLRGLVITLIGTLGIGLLAATVIWLLPAKKLRRIPGVSRPGNIVYQTAVRIPLSTALSEEILFRGVLLALALQHHDVWVAILISSLVFAAWHIIPTMRDHSATAVLPTVIVTAIAGLFFAWLRLVSGSLIAPWLMHWTINAAALFAHYALSKKAHDRVTT